MKKTNLLLLILCAFFIIGCTKTETPEIPNGGENGGETELPDEVKKDTLKALINEASSKDSSLYTTDSYNNLLSAKDSALIVYSNSSATQSEVDSAVSVLSAAISNLKQKEEPVVVNKDALKELIEKSEEIDEALYTDESYNNYISALHQAKDIYNKEDATQIEVNEMCTLLLNATDNLAVKEEISEVEINFRVSDVSFESIYLEWDSISDVDGYNVYCDDEAVDSELIRYYGDYYRCDIIGLTNKMYNVKVVPIINGEENEDSSKLVELTPISHIREGFAWVDGTSSGAYNEDGTLKKDATVIYVNNENKDSVSLMMQTGSTTKENIVGIQNILNTLKKGYYKNPICIRFIGNITDLAVLDKGDLCIDMSGKFSSGLTIEGIGNDAVFNGFGIRIKNSTNVEIRNIAFMNCNSDEGDNVSLQQDNDHIWVHNCDMFYGDAGSDSDQAKGDGALDCKKSTYVTFSFNHYFDSGKCNLQGMKDETTENYITYHHNWFDHSDSRHPRVRTCTVHVYNNFYDGISKYGVGATMGSSVFVENNYFKNSSRPMLSSLQGTDAQGAGTFSGENGGIIKAFGNVFDNSSTLIPYSQNQSSFDYYDASTRDEVVPSSVVTLVGKTTYNNFDTSASMYKYNVESANDAMNTVMKFAGRVQGGDFKWEFTDKDNSNYDVDTSLKQALKNYESNLVIIPIKLINKISLLPNEITLTDKELVMECLREYEKLSESSKANLHNKDILLNAVDKINGLEVENVINEIEKLTSESKNITDVYLLYQSLSTEQKEKVTNYSKLESLLDSVPVTQITHNFHEQGKESDFFEINGNLSTSKGTITYNGLTLTRCLKLESETVITFTISQDMKLILVFNPKASVKVDGVKYTSETNIIEMELVQGTHTITKADSTNLYYIVLE